MSEQIESKPAPAPSTSSGQAPSTSSDPAPVTQPAAPAAAAPAGTPQAQLVKELVDAGVHFGHRVSRWNPKMQPYILGKRNMIHIIDVRETIKGLLRAKRLVQQTVAAG